MASNASTTSTLSAAIKWLTKLTLVWLTISIGVPMVCDLQTIPIPELAPIIYAGGTICAPLLTATFNSHIAKDNSSSPELGLLGLAGRVAFVASFAVYLRIYGYGQLEHEIDTTTYVAKKARLAASSACLGLAVGDMLSHFFCLVERYGLWLAGWALDACGYPELQTVTAHEITEEVAEREE